MTDMLSLFPRIRCIVAVLLAAAGASNPVAAQTKPGNQPPFFPPGLGGSPDEFFEKLSGGSGAHDAEALRAIEISTREERDFGQPQVAAYLDSLQDQGLRFVKKGPDVDYLQKLVQTLKPFLQHPRRYPKFTIYVVDSPRVDARSFPGGTLVFFKGLLSFAENEAALVGIVGHELSHLDRGHLLVPLRRARLLQQSPDTGDFDPRQFFQQGSTLLRLAARPFRPEDESEADRDGAAWAYQAGYDPRELARLFARLHERSADPKLPFGALFRTHPYSDDRAAAILKLYDELQATDPRDPLYRGRKNLAQRIPKSQQEFPE